jgi:hypothetical protein
LLGTFFIRYNIKKHATSNPSSSWLLFNIFHKK